MMRYFCAVAALAGGAAAAKKGGDSAAGGAPLLTIGGAIQFTKSSLVLGKNLVSAFSSTTANAIYDVIPPDQQKMVSGLYNDAYTKAEALRKENGLPTGADLLGNCQDILDTKVLPPLTKGVDAAKKALFPVEKTMGAFVSEFEKNYPSSKGLFPGDILDQIFVLLFLTLGFFKIVWPIFTFFVCCGMCSSRKGDVAVIKKPNGKTDLTKKKK